MAGERDPRVNPKSGDVFRLGDDTRRVRNVDEYELEVERTGSLEARIFTLRHWRRWAKNAEVLHRAE